MAKRAKPAKPVKPTDLRSKLTEAAFKAAIRDGWRGLRIADVAKAAGMTVADAYKIAPDRPGLLDSYIDSIDAAVLQELAAGPGDTGAWRDAAFDGLMMRFDAMLKDRDALRVVYFDDQRDIVALARSARRSQRSIERILEASHFAKDTLALRAGALALLPLYARVFRLWLNDEADQAKTMAALDKALARLDGLKRRIGGRARSQAQQEPVNEEDGEAQSPRTNGTTH